MIRGLKMDVRRLVVGLLWDVGLPAVVFYACRVLGVDVVLALAAGGVAALVRVGWVAALRRRLNGLAALVAGSFLVLVGVSLLTGDPRILLARESILSGAAGLLLVGSCVVGRPVLYAVVRRLNAGKDEMLARWDHLWRTQPAFRRPFTVMSAVSGSVLLTEAAVRVVLVYLLPIDVMAGLSTVLHLGALALLACWVLWYRGRRQRAAQPATVERSHAR